MIWYAYTNKRTKNPNRKEDKTKYLYKYTFLGVIKADNGKSALKRARKKWPKDRGFDLKMKELVSNKKTGTVSLGKAPWVGKKDWMKIQAKYYAKKYGTPKKAKRK